MIPHIKYLWYLIRHKWYVFLECIRFRIPLRGLIHDWSKFLPCEWMPYTLSFYGPRKYKDRPQWLIDAFDRAWLHHIHRNTHHWQHFLLVQDDDEDKILPMADKDAIEMVCDWRGAGQAQGTPNTVGWYEKHKEKIKLNPDTRAFVEKLLYEKFGTSLPGDMGPDGWPKVNKWLGTPCFCRKTQIPDSMQRKETKMSNEPKVKSVQDRMKGLMEHAEKTCAHAKSIATHLGLRMPQEEEEKPDAESGPIGLIFCRIGSVHSILSRIDDTLTCISREIGTL